MLSRRCGARHSHTAHQSTRRSIYYAYHPFSGQEVEVVRALRRQAEQSVIVRLADGLQLAVPLWMLDPVLCGFLREESSPRISHEALLDLRELIDLTSLPSEGRVSKPLSSNNDGGNDDRAPTSPSSSPGDL